MEMKWKRLNGILNEDRTLIKTADNNTKLHGNNSDYTISEVLESYKKLTNKHK